jgi:type IV pilus assembly protein PilM
MRNSRKNKSVAAVKVEGGLSKLFEFLSRIKPAKGTLGIEITDRCIKLVEIVKRRQDSYEVQKFLIEKLPDHVVDDGRIKDSSRVILTLQTMLAQINCKVKKVHLILPSQSIMVRFLKLPNIPMKDLKKLIDFEMKHNIHLPFDSPFYDFVKLNEDEQETSVKPKKIKQKIKVKKEKSTNQAQLTRDEAAAATSELDLLFADQVDDNPEEQMLSQCDVMLVAAPQELIKEYQGILTSASLKPISMEFKALSLFRVMEFSDMVNPDSTILLIDINEHLSDVSIFHNQQLKITRNIPINFASNPKTAALVEDSFNFSQFEEKGTESEFITACHDLGYEIERLMNFYRYTLNNRDHEFSHILVSGDISRLNELVDRLAERVPCKISILRTNHFKSSHPDFTALFPSLAVPIGLALRGR